MILYFDLDKKLFVKPPGVRGAVRSYDFVRGDEEPIELHCLRDGEDVTDVTSIVAVIKSQPGDAAPALAVCRTWTPVGTSFAGVLDLNGEELNTLIGVKTSLNLLFEVTCYHDGTGPFTAAAVRALVKNDLWRGDEDSPSRLPDPENWMLNAILRDDGPEDGVTTADRIGQFYRAGADPGPYVFYQAATLKTWIAVAGGSDNLPNQSGKAGKYLKTDGANATWEAGDDGRINVKDAQFAGGAKGDGTTDDTAAVQAALNALESSTTRNVLYFPKGKYRLNTSIANSQTLTASRVVLTMGTTSGLDGRDIKIIGEPGATLYSTMSPVRANILLINVRMRSLEISGMRFEKDAVLMAPTAGEPNGTDGISLIRYDAREIEHVTIDDCVFFNTHGPLRSYQSDGNNLWGKLKLFRFTNNQVLNPYGSNVVADPTNEYGGGQQLNVTAWIGTAIVENNHFLGSADVCDPVTNPEGRIKDAAFFGSPLRLLFRGNSVVNFGIETVFVIGAAELLGYTSSTFAVPANDGATTTTFTVRANEDSTYRPGDKISVYSVGGSAYTVEMIVTAWNAGTRTITAKNSGAASNRSPGFSMTSPAMVYVSGQSISSAVISGNTFQHNQPVNCSPLSGGEAIVVSSRSVVTDNLIRGFQRGIFMYGEAHTPEYDRARGTIIANNSIEIVSPADNVSPYSSGGIEVNQSFITVKNNTVTTAFNFKNYGVRVLGHDCKISGNTAIALTHQSNAASGDHSIGYAEGAAGANNVYSDNYSSGWDAGIGANNRSSPRSAIITSHQSVGDDVSIEPTVGVFPTEGGVPTVSSSGLTVPMSGASQVVRKLENESRSTEVLANDGDLKFSALKNRSYYVRGTVLYSAATSGGGIKLKLDVPANATFVGRYSVTVGGVAKYTDRRMLQTTTISTNDAAPSGECIVSFEGVLKVTNTSGPVNLQWARNTSHTDPTTMTNGSGIIATMGL